MVIDGRKIAHEIKYEISAQLKKTPPKRVYFVMFGDNPASHQFMKIKSRVGERLGVICEIKLFDEITTTEEGCSILKNLMKENVQGVVLQLPLPKHMDGGKMISMITPEKDIDVLGKILHEDYTRVAPVARAVIRILDHTGVTIMGKKIVIIGQGRLVGKPISEAFNSRGIPYDVIDVTTTSDNRATLLASADIIISGVGIPHMITKDMIKEGVIIIDAGTSKQGGSLVGDFHPDCSTKASYMTPVPGGIGPVTVISLFENLLHIQ